MAPTASPPGPDRARRPGRAAVLLLATLLAVPLAGCLSRSDAIAPLVTIYEPQSGTTRSAEALLRSGVRGYALDDEGIVAIRINGVDILQAETYASERGKRFIDFAFRPTTPTEGETVTTIEVLDSSGRTTRFPYTLRVDATPPTLELLDVRALGDGRLQVRGVARDNTLVSSVLVSGEPLQFIPSAEVPFEIDVAASESGQVEVVDGAGNRTARSLR